MEKLKEKIKKYAVQVALGAIGGLCIFFAVQAGHNPDASTGEVSTLYAIGVVLILGGVAVNIVQRKKHIDGF